MNKWQKVACWITRYDLNKPFNKSRGFKFKTEQRSMKNMV